MRNMIKRLFAKGNESTAEILSHKLLSKGILQDDIKDEHILKLYGSLKMIKSAPDFASVNNMLANECGGVVGDSCPIWGVIVETRAHPAIEIVVNNFIRNAQIPIQIFHGNNNLEYIMSTNIADLARDGKVRLTRLDVDDLSANKYNALFLSKRFWRHIIGRKKILVFQTDALSCNHAEYAISDFCTYDYIGSKWPRMRPIGIKIDGGNGGLSLRDWEKSYACLNRFRPSYWSGGEDGYFAFHIELIGGKVGKGDDCAQFSTQYEFQFKSWGAHKISCLNEKDQRYFIDYCQDAEFLLG